ncbi:MAG TPA: hypothetical protein VFW69_04710 [Mycobacterium sp.]|nr:hypothetical protein [Mycobacterium sp.]
MTAPVDPSVPPSGMGCVECDEVGGWWVHLRRCAACGDIGCCDEHVGVSTDFSFDAADFTDELQRNQHLFDDSYTRWGPIQWIAPETFLMLGAHLRRRGWSTSDVDAALGGNFYRVARQAWRS